MQRIRTFSQLEQAIEEIGFLPYAGDEKRSAPLHSDRFDFDEAALLPAIAWYTRIIDTYAKED